MLPNATSVNNDDRFRETEVLEKAPFYSITGNPLPLFSGEGEGQEGQINWFILDKVLLQTLHYF